MKYIIHRGIISNKIKENSFTAIKKALLDKESSGVEFDIKLTKDNKIILYHDPLLNFNIIENMSYKEILKYKYITTLDKILDINSNKIFLLDIKTNHNYKNFADILLKTLNNYNKNIYISSFDTKIINYLKNKTKYKKGIITYKYKKNNYNFISINYKAKKIEKLKNKEIFLWTINKSNEIIKLTKKYSNYNNMYLIINKSTK